MPLHRPFKLIKSVTLNLATNFKNNPENKAVYLSLGYSISILDCAPGTSNQPEPGRTPSLQ